MSESLSPVSVPARGGARVLTPRPPARVPPTPGAGPPRPWWRTRHGRALLAIIALAAGVRLAQLGVQSYWLDEAYTVRIVDGSLADVLRRVPESESTSHLYYLLAWTWAQAFGTGEAGLRSLSALCGIGLVAVAYAAGTRLVSVRAGLAAAALVAVNPLLVHYSLEARSYSLLTLLAGLSFLCFVRLVRQPGTPSRRALVAWTATSALALAAHYFAAFLVVPEALWLLAVVRPRRPVALAVGAVAAAGAALVPLAAEQASRGGAVWIDDDPLGMRSVQVGKQFLTGFDAPAEGAATALAVLLVLAALVLLLRRGGPVERGAAMLAGAIGAVAVLGPLALGAAGADLLTTRNVIAAWLPLALVVAVGATSPTRGRPARAGVAVVIALCVLWLALVLAVAADPRYQRDDWRGAAAALGGRVEGGRAILVSPAQGVVPLRVYRPHARPPASPGPGGPAPPSDAVREIDVLAIAPHDPGATRRRPVPATLAPPAPGFVLVAREERSTWTVLRYRAPARVTLSPAAMGGTARFGRAAALLLEPGPRR